MVRGTALCDYAFWHQPGMLLPAGITITDGRQSRHVAESAPRGSMTAPSGRQERVASMPGAGYPYPPGPADISTVINIIYQSLLALGKTGASGSCRLNPAIRSPNLRRLSRMRSARTDASKTFAEATDWTRLNTGPSGDLITQSLLSEQRSAFAKQIGLGRRATPWRRRSST